MTNTLRIQSTSLTGAALDYAVTMIVDAEAVSHGPDDWADRRRNMTKHGVSSYRWSSCREQGGELLECYGIGLTPPMNRKLPNGSVLRSKEDGWFATSYTEYDDGDSLPGVSAYGATPLIAGMRCIVKRYLGDHVEIPESIISL